MQLNKGESLFAAIFSGAISNDNFFSRGGDVEEATHIHGITNDMIKDAPEWLEVLAKVIELTSLGWVAYNAKFDERMILQTSGACPDPYDLVSPECAKQRYAEFNGEWDYDRCKYKWKRLVDAATALNVDAGEGVAHRSLFDCRLTMGVIRAIASRGAK